MSVLEGGLVHYVVYERVSRGREKRSVSISRWETAPPPSLPLKAATLGGEKGILECFEKELLFVDLSLSMDGLLG